LGMDQWAVSSETALRNVSAESSLRVFSATENQGVISSEVIPRYSVGEMLHGFFLRRGFVNVFPWERIKERLLRRLFGETYLLIFLREFFLRRRVYVLLLWERLSESSLKRWFADFLVRENL
jgi:hypothetical protein